MVTFLMIKLAKNASNKLSGIAKGNIPIGRILIFPITIHINAKPTNHERNVVCNNENFFEIINIEMAKHKDHKPQTAPLIGAEGKMSPSFS